MKKKALAVAAVLTVSALFLAGGYYANSEQLQGRFSNLSFSGEGKVFEGKAKDNQPKLLDGAEFDFSDAVADEESNYFNILSSISSSMTLDESSDDAQIIGHYVLDFTNKFRDEGSETFSMDINKLTVYVYDEDGNSNDLMLSYFDEWWIQLDDDTANMTETAGEFSFSDLSSDASYTIQVWATPSSVTELYADAENMSIGLGDITIDGVDYTAGSSNPDYVISDEYSTGFIQSHMTFSF